MAMTIDGWDIANANARQRRLVIGHHDIKNNSEWVAGSDRPVFAQSDLDFKSITVEIEVKGNDYADIVRNRGLILSKLRSDVHLDFDRTPNHFHCVLNKADKPDEKAKDRWHIMKLEFSGYEYGDEMHSSADSSVEFTINNVGTMDTPVTLVITPTDRTIIGNKTSERVYGILDDDGSVIYDPDGDFSIVGYDETYGGLHIEGLCYDPVTGEPAEILIKNYTTGTPIRIDGETGLISEDGVSKIDDVEMWAMPTIKPGVNKIVTNGEFMDIQIYYKPRYM